MRPRGTSVIVGQLALLCAIACWSVTGATTASDWHPVGLLWLLAAAATITALYPVKVREMQANGSAAACVLAAIVLNPLAALVIVALTITAGAIKFGGWRHFVCNLTAGSVYALAAPLATGAKGLGLFDSNVGVVLCTTMIFLVVNGVNFLVVAVDVKATSGDSILDLMRNVYGPALPVQFVSALLTGTLTLGYVTWGTAAITLIAAVALLFQYITHIAFESIQRGEELGERTKQLASLQLGLVTMTLKTLALRDNSTARHSTAVARYSRAMAIELGLNERDQELIHIAALFHDVGKFVFPDSILKAERRLTPEEREIVNSHSAVGADLIAEIEGYGPVAELVRSHHERIDGFGYPDRLVGDEIPLGSRIISVADIYDVITARDTYRTPVTIPEAIAELRRSAGTQLDSRVVEVFVGLVMKKGLAFRHATEDDFEAELALEHRIRDYAEPRTVASVA